MQVPALGLNLTATDHFFLGFYKSHKTNIYARCQEARTCIRTEWLTRNQPNSQNTTKCDLLTFPIFVLRNVPWHFMTILSTLLLQSHNPKLTYRPAFHGDSCQSGSVNNNKCRGEKLGYCQAQGQTWNVKSKLDPEIGSVMGQGKSRWWSGGLRNLRWMSGERQVNVKY